mgnify:FL=1|jgi:hypothetical protein
MKKKNIITSITMIILAVIYTILVKIIDVAPIGPNNSEVGFSKINGFFHNLLGSNMTIYKITEILGIIPLLMAGIYAIIGLVELIKRKSLTKVDYEIYALAGLYVVVLGLYVFFEKCIINYRPILIDGVLEASYPSSHTLMALCICGSSIIVNKRIFHKKIFNLENKLSIFLMITIILGRFISGVHWFSDIIGAIFISLALLSSFYTAISSFTHKKVVVKKEEQEEDSLPIPIKEEAIYEI